MTIYLSKLFEDFRQFRNVWVAGGWSWDRRFECVASTFDQSRADEACRLVAGVLPERWTSATLKNAPRLIVEVADATGGVRSDQLLYATPEADGIIAYGLWWPWGGEGTNISMRVGLAGRASFDHMAKLREVFNAPDE